MILCLHKFYMVGGELMDKYNVFWSSISKLYKNFFGNPLFNVFYRWFLICFFTTISGYFISYFLSNQKFPSVFVSISVFIVTSFVFSYYVFHLPHKKNRRYLYIMLYSNSKDTALVINGLTQKCLSLSKGKSYSIYCPNKSCRYFYNWFNSNFDVTNSKFFKLIEKYINKNSAVLLYGALNDEQANSKEVSKIIPNILINANSDSINDVTTVIQNTSFVIRHNNSFDDLDAISQIILSYADYVFSVINNNPQIKSLNTILDIYENAINVSSNFPQSQFTNIIEEMTTKITSDPIDENQINEYIFFCKRFLGFFPDNKKILLDLQYFSISNIKNKAITTADIKKIAKDLLSISNINSSNDLDDNILELNKAYLLLLVEDFNSAINIYQNVQSIPPAIYNFFVETINSPSLGIYSKYAFIINYYSGSSSYNHNLAMTFTQDLKEEFKNNSNSELYKSFQKFIKRKKYHKKNWRLFN